MRETRGRARSRGLTVCHPVLHYVPWREIYLTWFDKPAALNPSHNLNLFWTTLPCSQNSVHKQNITFIIIIKIQDICYKHVYTGLNDLRKIFVWQYASGWYFETRTGMQHDNLRSILGISYHCMLGMTSQRCCYIYSDWRVRTWWRSN